MDGLPYKLEDTDAPPGLSPAKVADLFRAPAPADRDNSVWTRTDKGVKKLDLQPADQSPKLTLDVTPRLSLGLSLNTTTPPNGAERAGRTITGFDKIEPVPGSKSESGLNRFFGGAMIHFQARF